MLGTVLLDVASDLGLDPVQRRSLLVRLLNRAAKEMHHDLECNKIYKEVTLVVPRNKVVSLPSFVGELRGMRMVTNEWTFNVNSLNQPRYASNTIGYKYNNWRDIGDYPIHTLLSDVGQLTLSCFDTEDDPVDVTIVGTTNSSYKVQETITMDATSKSTTNLFGPEIFVIGCMNSNRIFDITIKDLNANEIAVLRNTDQKTRYKVVDVSQVFWSIDTSNDESFIDVLYKLPISNLVNDGDSFYAGDDFDEAWYNMSMFFHLRNIENRQPEALQFQKTAFDILQSAKDSGERGIAKHLNFGRNKYHDLFRRHRYSYPGAGNYFEFGGGQP